MKTSYATMQEKDFGPGDEPITPPVLSEQDAAAPLLRELKVRMPH